MKKMLGLLVSLTAISGACAAVLAYVNSITAEPIAATAEKAREAAKAAVLCGEEGYTAEGRSGEGYGGEIKLICGVNADGSVAASRAYRREDLALTRIRKSMQARERANVVKVGNHVGVEDDLHRLRGRRPRKRERKK